MEDGSWKMENGDWILGIRDWRLRSIFQSPISNLQSPISTFLQDRRGASLVTYALVLPLLVLIIFGASTVWRIISIKQSMDLASYEAARYLAREGRDIGSRALPYYDPERWRAIALERIDVWMRHQIRRNPFIGGEDRIDIDVMPPASLDCNPWLANLTDHERLSDDIRFTVTTRLSLESPLRIPFMPPVTFTLQEKHSDLVECPRFRRDPPDEGDIF